MSGSISARLLGGVLIGSHLIFSASSALSEPKVRSNDDVGLLIKEHVERKTSEFTTSYEEPPPPGPDGKRAAPLVIIAVAVGASILVDAMVEAANKYKATGLILDTRGEKLTYLPSPNVPYGKIAIIGLDGKTELLNVADQKIKDNLGVLFK